MSTTIKSAICPREFSAEVSKDGNEVIIIVTEPNRKAGLSVFAVDLLSALRAEGVLTEDDGLRGRVEAVAGAWSIRALHGNKEALEISKDLRDALNPPAPFQFPTGFGAMVEGEHKRDGGTGTWVRHSTEDIWTRSTGSHWNAEEIAYEFTNLRTLSEGVTL